MSDLAWGRKHWPLLVYTVVALAVMAPLLRRGFLLHYDMVLSPWVHFDWAGIREGRVLLNQLPVTFALWVSSLALPVDVVQKLLLLGILVCSGYTMYRVMPTGSRPARAFAGLFYQINPLVYDRFMAGHWLFLAAYAVTPLALGCFYKLFVRPCIRAMLLAGAVWGGIATISPHHLVIVGLLFFAMSLVFVRSRRQAWFGLGTVAVALLLVSWWLVPLRLFPNVTSSFGLDQFYAFATRSDPAYGIWLNMVALQGFWYEGWISIKNFIPLWPVVWLAWLMPVFVGLGGWRTYTISQRRLVAALAVGGLGAIVLAAGPNPATVQLNAWIFQHVPGMSGLREPQKLLAIVALAYAVLGGFGAELVWVRLRPGWRFGVLGGAAVAVVGMSYPLFWGCHGQLRVVQYPQSWYRFNEYLRTGPPGRVLVLPYEQYVHGGFTGDLVAQPAASFFGSRVVVSGKMNLPGVDQKLPSDAAYALLEAALLRRDPGALHSVLHEGGIGYIMLTGFDDSLEYRWAGLAGKVVLDEGDLTVWAVN